MLAYGSKPVWLSVCEQSLSEYDLLRGGGMAKVRPVKEDVNMAAARADLELTMEGKTLLFLRENTAVLSVHIEVCTVSILLLYQQQTNR